MPTIRPNKGKLGVSWSMGAMMEKMDALLGLICRIHGKSTHTINTILPRYFVAILSIWRVSKMHSDLEVSHLLGAILDQYGAQRTD